MPTSSGKLIKLPTRADSIGGNVTCLSYISYVLQSLHPISIWLCIFSVDVIDPTPMTALVGHKVYERHVFFLQIQFGVITT